jgi:ribosomal protein L24
MRTQNNTNATKVVIEGLQVTAEKVTPDQRMNRMRLQEELNSQQVQPLSFEEFEKTAEEKKILKDLKKTAPKGFRTPFLPLEIFKDVWERGSIQKN